MDMKLFLKKLEEYLDKEILPNKYVITHLSAQDFISDINNQLEDIQVVLDFQLPELLRYYEKKKNISSSEICKIVDKSYDSIKNRSHSFTSFDKEVLYKVAICFSLSYEETSKLMSYAHFLINPIDNPLDAAFFYFSVKWDYNSKKNTPEENIELFCLCVEHTKKYLSRNEEKPAWNSIKPS